MVDIAEQITTSGRSTCGTEIIFRVGIARSTVLVRELDPTTKQYVEVARFQLSIDPKPDVYDTKIEAQDTRIRLVIAEGTTSWRIVEALKSIDILKGEINSIPSVVIVVNPSLLLSSKLNPNFWLKFGARELQLLPLGLKKSF